MRAGIPPTMMSITTAEAIEKAIGYERERRQTCGNCHHYQPVDPCNSGCTLHAATLGARLVSLGGACDYHTRMLSTSQQATLNYADCRHLGMPGVFAGFCPYCVAGKAKPIGKKCARNCGGVYIEAGGACSNRFITGCQGGIAEFKP